jgi:hypothetical protein
MDYKRYELGGLKIRYDLTDYPVEFKAPIGFKMFESKYQADFDANFRLHLGCPPLKKGRKILLDSKSFWKSYSNAGQIVITVDSYYTPSVIGYTRLPRVCIIGKNKSNGDIYIYSDRNVKNIASLIREDIFTPIGHPLDQILITLLVENNAGLLLHACGVKTRQGGLLFVGKSGAGKSTTARLWAGKGKILNDDRIIIRKLGDGYHMFGTPWSGSYKRRSRENQTVNSILFIEHGKENRLSRMSMAESVTSLMNNCFSVNWTRNTLKKRLSICEDISRSVGCYRFRFTPDNGSLECIAKRLFPK